VLIVSVLTASILATALVQAEHEYANPSYPIGQPRIQQAAESVVTAFDAALNVHDVKAGLNLFTDDALVHDAARETYSAAAASTSGKGPGVAPTCFASYLQPTGVCVYSGKDRIGEWLQQLVVENIQVQEVGDFQTSGSNVTWILAISDDNYRSIGIASLSEVGFATVEGNKIQFLTLSLTPDSANELQAAFVRSERPQVAFGADVLLIGLAALGLTLPLGSIYYISRVKNLFAAVPRLERPWLLLEAGICLLFLDVVLTMFGSLVGIPPGTADVFRKVFLVASAGSILVGMVLMKRAWTIPSSE
jgi:hypothetical protein